MQAAMIYGMLCSQCTDSVSSDDSAWVVETIEVSSSSCPLSFNCPPGLLTPYRRDRDSPRSYTICAHGAWIRITYAPCARNGSS